MTGREDFPNMSHLSPVDGDVAIDKNFSAPEYMKKPFVCQETERGRDECASGQDFLDTGSEFLYFRRTENMFVSILSSAFCMEKCMIKGQFESLGVYFPDRVVSTQELIDQMPSKPFFDLESLTGVKNRRWRSDSQDSYTMAMAAAENVPEKVPICSKRPGCDYLHLHQ